MHRFVWDEDKRLTNLRKHAIDFIDAVAVFDGVFVTIEDERFEYEEPRFVTLGSLKGRIIAVVHVERGEITRIISARKASSHEQEIYFQHLND
jgi:uncharacterized DUF497 family protein